MAATSAPGAGPAARAAGKPEEHAQRGGLHLPTVHAPLPHLPAGTAGNVLWWGGLAAVAAFGVVDWPVVALVAAGTWVAEQHAKAAQRPAGNGAAGH